MIEMSFSVALRSLPALVIGLAVWPSPLSGQGPRAWLVASAAIGGSTAAGPRYKGSPVWGAAFGGGVHLRGSVGVEAGLDVFKKWGLPVLECDLPPSGQCPIHFDLTGLSARLVLNAAPAGKLSRVRPSLGAGIYRVADNSVHEPTVLGLKIGLDYTGLRWSHQDLAVGVHALIIPRANGELLWVLPVGVSVHFF